MLTIGIIVGKDDWYSNKKNVEPRFLTNKSYTSTDVAIAEKMRKKFKDVKIEMLLSKDITVDRLSKNDVNFILGHDLVDAFWRKGNHYEEFTKIYKNPSSNIFPTYTTQKFVLDKGEYYNKFKKAGVPVLPTFYIKNSETEKQTAEYVINQAKKFGWDEFITKPELGAWGRMFKKWNLKKLENKSEQTKLDNYLKNKKVLHFPAIIFQKSAPGFKDFWEIRTYWFDGKFSHAIGTKHDFKLQDDEITTDISPSIIRQCKKIGLKALTLLPKSVVHGKIIQPAMVRIDCGCCVNGLNGEYFLNEIENQACNLFPGSAKELGIDIIDKFANVLYKKAKELTKKRRKSKI